MEFEPLQMISMDPNNCEWLLCLHLVEKFRREAVNKYGAVGEPEKQSILKAMRCPGAKNDPRVLTGYLSCLADVFRNACRGYSFDPFVFGSETYSSAYEVVRKIQAQAE